MIAYKMKWLLRKCEKCKRYTFQQEHCPYCGGPAVIPHPAKFSINDKYLKYRGMQRKKHVEDRFKRMSKEGL